jgi:hypothetical protein
VYGGFEQRGGLPLSTPRFQADGIWSGSRSGYDPSLYPSFQPASVAPAIGVALESAGVTWIHGRLVYRRVYNTGSSNVTEFASGLFAPASYSGTRISTERFGYAIDGTWAGVLGFKAGIVYDLYRAEVTSAYASLDGYLAQKFTLSADYDLYVPTFDADSIWNFFAGEPRNDFGLRANVDVNDKLAIAASGNLRMFTVQTTAFDPQGNGMAGGVSALYAMNALYPTNGHPFDEGFNVSARWRTGETRLALRGAGNFGDEGHRVGGDLSGEHIFETRYVLGGRAGLWNWTDALRPDRSIPASLGLVATLGYRFMPRSQASIEGEYDANTLVGQRFRLLLLLNVGVGK